MLRTKKLKIDNLQKYWLAVLRYTLREISRIGCRVPALQKRTTRRLVLQAPTSSAQLYAPTNRHAELTGSGGRRVGSRPYGWTGARWDRSPSMVWPSHLPALYPGGRGWLLNAWQTSLRRLPFARSSRFNQLRGKGVQEVKVDQSAGFRNPDLYTMVSFVILQY